MKKLGFSASSFPTICFYTVTLTLSSLFCPVTAFNIPVNSAVLFFFCIISAFLVALCMSFRKYWIPLGMLLVIYLFFFSSFLQTALAGFRIALETVSEKFSTAFDGYSKITLNLGSENTDTATIFFLFLGDLVSIAVAWTVARRHSPWIVLLVCFPYLNICLFIVKSAPAVWAILMMLSSFALLVMTQGLRRQNSNAEKNLTLKLAVPMLALVLALSAVFPYSSYRDSKWAFKMQDRLNEIFDDLPFMKINSVTGQLQFNPDGFNSNIPGFGVWKPELKRVDLSAVGPQSKNGIRVMQIKASKSGRLYLRGVSLAVYRGNAWTAVDSEAYRYLKLKISPHTVTSTAFDGSETLEIKTLDDQVLLYTPYYLSKIPRGYLAVDDAYIDNTNEVKSYKLNYSPDFGGVYNSSIPNPSDLEDYERYVRQYYTFVPPDVMNTLIQLAYNAGLIGLPDSALPRAVADYVSGSAVYDLNTEKVPAGQDFTLWFLTQSHKGYCTHFATATALMLRALGIPSRYVTGYMVNAAADEWVYVTDDNAHAWVEYYVSGLGWIPLESTASASGFAPETEDPDESSRPETTVPKSDSPSETTAPGNSASTSPAGPTPRQRKTIKISKYWLFALLPLAVAAVFRAYRLAVLRKRSRRFHRGEVNRRALAIWNHIIRLSEFAGENAPDALKELAQKAKFSQHKLSKTELGRLLAHAAELTDKLSNTKNIFQKLYYKYILAII